MDPSKDWSNLPREMLEPILERLKDPLDLLRCPGVCGSWFSIGRQILPLQLSILPPLLMFSDKTGREIVFHNYLTRKERRISLPVQYSCYSCLLGGSHGWLISIPRESPHQIHLINAISLAQIRLPLLQSFILGNRSRIVMSTNPLLDPNCIVLAIYRHMDHLVFYRLGDRTWRRLSTVDTAHCNAATFYKGKFYVFKSTTGQITQINFGDFQNPKVVTWEPQGLSDDILRSGNIWSRDDCLMESSGELLLVTTYMINSKRMFKVHKLDRSMGVWIEVDDLGDRALFVGYYNSMSVVVPAAANELEDGSCSGFKRCRANSMYFVDHSDCSIYDMKTREYYKECIPGCGRIWHRSPISWIRPDQTRSITDA